MANFGWDATQVYHSSGLPLENSNQEEQSTTIERKFADFLRNFRLENDFVYRNQMRRNFLIRQYFVEVDMNHLASFDAELANQLRLKPAEFLPLFENATKQFALDNQLFSDDLTEIPDCSVMLLSNTNPIPLRDLESTYISQLVRVHGIVIASSTLAAKATYLHLMCRQCRHVKQVAVSGGFSGITLPRKCDAPVMPGEKKDCPLDPFVIVGDKCRFIDQQTLKIQETLDMIPVGELPRHMLLTADRFLVNKVVPGTRVTITGIFDIFQSKAIKSAGAVALRSSYLRVVGIQADADGNTRVGRSFNEEEETECLRMSRDPLIYQKFAQSIAPSVYGSEDMKRAIACLLFGGSKKVLPDGMRLRGDINVLMLGDPGTAKSQLLKFVEKVAPIAVYTSGKGSSAAGLTASVIRDPSSREFYLEGGAMVLADGGVVCIDEFDKMREEDRVAIHEAMEQQTISIAKAGITTILNSRTSVLAAANPVFGRYNDLKSPGENIDFQTTILSRFDMIFIVRDEHNEARDSTIARHVLNVHMNNQVESAVGEYDLQKMRMYISYCKQKCAPRLSPEAVEKLSSYFVTIRSEVQNMRQKAHNGQMVKSTIPITVRQLEATIRIAESLAKMRLCPVATIADVDEAIRLFKGSTLNAVQSGFGNMSQDVDKIQELIKKRLPLGWTSPELVLKAELMKHDFSEASIEAAFHFLVQKNVLLYKERRKVLTRIAL